MLISKENVPAVRKMLQTFNEDLGVHINDDQRHKLGRVLTIIDASIADPDQRKAIKDLVNEAWWGSSNRESKGPMLNPHTDLRAIANVLGFELYVYDPKAVPEGGPDDFEKYATKRYEKIAKVQELVSQ